MPYTTTTTISSSSTLWLSTTTVADDNDEDDMDDLDELMLGEQICAYSLVISELLVDFVCAFAAAPITFFLLWQTSVSWIQ